MVAASTVSASRPMAGASTLTGLLIKALLMLPILFPATSDWMPFGADTAGPRQTRESGVKIWL